MILTFKEVGTDHNFCSNRALSSLFFRFLLDVTFLTHLEKAALTFRNGSYTHVQHNSVGDDDDEVMLNVLRCRLIY